MKKLTTLAIASLLAISSNAYSEDTINRATETTPVAASNEITGHIARAQLTTAVVSREPVDKVGPTVTGSGEEPFKLYYFTDLRDFSGHVVTHRWEKDGEIVADVNFTVGANRWRTFSSKNFNRHMTGNWQVSVIYDEKIVHSTEFIFQWENTGN